MDVIIKLLLKKWKLIKPKFLISLLNSNTELQGDEKLKTRFTNDIVKAVMESSRAFI